MKALLICPADRPAVAVLAEACPLVAAPLLGRSLIEYWLTHLAALGARRVLVIASDRPDQVRSVIGDGARWGLEIDLHPESRELTIEEARAKYRAAEDGDWLAPPNDLILLDHLPGLPERRMFDSYTGWFAALQAWVPRALTPDRIGLREIQPGVWAGLHTRIAPGAVLRAPCWLGENVFVGQGARVGPQAILENRAFVESRARISRSVIGPDTFVGPLTLIENSLAWGSTLLNWQSNSLLRVPDAFLLCSLGDHQSPARPAGWPGRCLAALALLLTAPLALAVMLRSTLRGEPALRLRRAVRPLKSVRCPPDETFVYHELPGVQGWLRRWPQLWSIARGDFAWIGNRPLGPGDAAKLANDFERLWLTVPVGMISLADAEGCPDGLSEAACAHASFYAARAGWRLNWCILARALVHAVTFGAAFTDRRRELLLAFPRPLLKEQE